MNEKFGLFTHSGGAGEVKMIIVSGGKYKVFLIAHI
jgi:hypothetical protein